MTVRAMKSGGGWQAVEYTFRKAKQVGPVALLKSMSSRNACKTCALGMGGQAGGMRNEQGHFPEFCKKSLQAMVSDMQGQINPAFFERYSVGDLRAMTPLELEACGRLVDPLVLRQGDSHYRPVPWDVALDEISANLAASAPEKTAFYASGRSSNEAGFLLQLLARAHGTSHVNNCSYYCHQASGVGLNEALGTGTATLTLDDLDECDCFYLIGGNPASNHPRLMTKLVEIRERGGKVVVVNPLREPGLVKFRIPSRLDSFVLGSEVASRYLQVKTGGDQWLFAGMAKWLVSHGKVESAFINKYTESYGILCKTLDSVSWQEIEANSGLTRFEIKEAANEYAESQRAVWAWTMGVTHHADGVGNVRWIVNMALLRAMVGKPGAGLLPIRGHSNVQGLGSVGVTPQLRSETLQKLVEKGVPEPRFEGYDTMAMMEAARDGRLDFLLCLGGNLFGSNPDSRFVSESYGTLKTVVYLNTTLNTGHAHGTGHDTYILPVLARDEEPQATTQESMFNYVRLSDGGPSRHRGPRAESDILASLAKQARVSSLPWEELRSHNGIRSWIADIVPGYEPVRDIGSTKKEFSVLGRSFNDLMFKTDSGRAKFWCASPTILEQPADGGFLLMTIRSEGQFNTVVYEEDDIYRGQNRRDIVLMNGQDMRDNSISTGDLVSVTSEVGTMGPVLARAFDIARGCVAMYYPEANQIVPRRIDPKSKTPAFKSVPVQISRMTDPVGRRGTK